jgi:hypothetical protein
MTARMGTWTANRPRSLTLAFYRHMAILVGAAVLVVALGGFAPIEAQPLAWIAAAAGAGAVAALMSGWIGLVFLVVGLGIGVVLDLAVRHPATGDTVTRLAANPPWHAAAAVAAVIAFAVVLLIKRRFSGRG